LEVCADDECAMLVTSHDMREVERLCERVVFLAHGRVVADGTPSAIVDRFGQHDLEGVFVDLATGVLRTAEDQL
jgi:ABC-2 type transport system ATP-binding protein